MKTFRLTVWAKYLSMLCSILLFLKSLFFNFGFWWSLLLLVVSVVYVFLDFSKCISMCWKGAKDIEEKLAMLRAPLVKGAIFLVIGIIVFRYSVLLSILMIVCGLFYVGGNFLDKKPDDGKAPMV